MNIIISLLKMPNVPLVVYTDSGSLYECLVKLKTMKEKRSVIDVMVLCQSYKRRDISEIRRINNKDDPADAMTKASRNQALGDLINNNKITVRREGWVDEKEAKNQRNLIESNSI